MKAKFFLILTSILILTFGVSYGSSVTLETDMTDGLYNTDTLIADGATDVVFYIRLTNTSGVNVSGITNGFVIKTTDDAVWTQVIGDTLDVNGASAGTGWKSMFDLIFAINVYVADGRPDTIGFGGSKMFSTGLPIGFDAVSYSINIGPLATTDHGKHIRLDSTYYPPTGSWLWAPGGAPSWDGPHDFVVVDPVQLDVNDSDNGLPKSFALMQNYPNPFNPTTTVLYDVPTRSQVRIDIYNVLGQKVKTLVNGMKDAGSYQEPWDGSSDGGSKVSSGIYFYKMVAGDYVSTKKMMMLK